MSCYVVTCGVAWYGGMWGSDIRCCNMSCNVVEGGMACVSVPCGFMQCGSICWGGYTIQYRSCREINEIRSYLLFSGKGMNFKAATWLYLYGLKLPKAMKLLVQVLLAT